MAMGKHVFTAAALVATVILSAVSCSRGSMDRDYETPNYYLLTLDNQSSTDVVWFVPYHGNVACGEAGRLPESLSGTDYCQFPTKAHDRFRVNVTGEKGGPFESYHKDDKVSFYVFDAAVFNSLEWSEIVRDEKWLAKFQYTAREVVDKDKKIVYTGE